MCAVLAIAPYLLCCFISTFFADQSVSVDEKFTATWVLQKVIVHDDEMRIQTYLNRLWGLLNFNPEFWESLSLHPLCLSCFVSQLKSDVCYGIVVWCASDIIYSFALLFAFSCQEDFNFTFRVWFRLWVWRFLSGYKMQVGYNRRKIGIHAGFWGSSLDSLHL